MTNTCHILKYYDDIFIQTRRLAFTYIANLFFNTFDKISYHSFLLRLSEYNSIKCYMYHTNMYYVGTLLSSLIIIHRNNIISYLSLHLIDPIYDQKSLYFTPLSSLFAIR